MQDPDNARISPCALPFLGFAPAGIILLVVLGHLLSPSLQRWRPNWTLPFITGQDEKQDASDEFQSVSTEGKHPIRWTLALLFCSAIGFSAEVVNCLPASVDLGSIVFVASWVSSHLP